MRSVDDDRLPDIGFQDEVWLWLHLLSAQRPELAAEARRRADPGDDPWGYLAELGELVLGSR